VEGRRCASAVVDTDRPVEKSPTHLTSVDEESCGTGE
jgi:hypothetical protein